MSDSYLLTLTCNNKECMLRARLGRILNKPSMRVGGFKFCPQCGGPANAGQDSDEDYMETLGAAYGFSVEVMRMLLDTWPTQEYNKFSDYIASLQQEIADDDKVSSVA